jgi:hypothetical protein
MVATVQIGTKLLHCFALCFLFQQVDPYTNFLQGFQSASGKAFTYRTFDENHFMEAAFAHTTLGDAYGVARCIFWEAYRTAHELYGCNQVGLCAHFLQHFVAGRGIHDFKVLLKNAAGISEHVPRALIMYEPIENINKYNFVNARELNAL